MQGNVISKGKEFIYQIPNFRFRKDIMEAKTIEHMIAHCLSESYENKEQDTYIINRYPERIVSIQRCDKENLQQCDIDFLDDIMPKYFKLFDQTSNPLFCFLDVI